jgi:hypothetical protein
MSEKERVLQAVNYLVESDDYSRLIKELTETIERFDKRPMVYAGKLELLNILIDIGVANRAAFERLVTLIEDKRKLIPQVRRVDYQRELMAQRRARVAKAIELHELTKGRKVTLDERTKFTKDIQARWAKERDDYILARGNLDWHGRNEATREFWLKVDTTLDTNIKGARRKPS